MNPKGKTKKRKTSRAGIYSLGELNKIIASLFHPLAERNATLLLVDEALHIMVEDNLNESARKFLKFSVPTLTRTILDQQTKRKKKTPS